MNILAYKDLILAYIRNDANDKQQILVQKIFYNENSIFLYSKKFIEFLKKEIDQSPTSRELVRFEAFINKIQNAHQDKRPCVKFSEASQNFDEEFLHIYATAQSNVIVSIAHDNPSPEIKKSIPKIAILSQQKKPNYHWVLVNLAICHPFTLSVDEADFTNDTEIQQFFNDLFSIPKKIESVTIFDDYCNLSHNRYDKVKNEKVFYCTADCGKTQNLERTKIVKAKFHKAHFFTKYGGSHTRRIIFEDFIINPDNDVNMLNKEDNKMWSIHIRFSEELAKKIVEPLKNGESDYKKFIP